MFSEIDPKVAAGAPALLKSSDNAWENVGGGRRLTQGQFQSLSQMPAEFEWFANLPNPQTRRAYQSDLKDFMCFVGIERIEEFRRVTRPHLIAWRRDLETREASPATIRRKLSALGSLFNFLCEANAVSINPVQGIKRPLADTNEGKSPVLGDPQAQQLLNAPQGASLKSLRDRAILSTLLYHALRRAEVCGLRLDDIQSRRGSLHFRVRGKGGKIRFVPMRVHTQQCIHDYLAVLRIGRGEEDSESAQVGRQPLFCAVRASRSSNDRRPLTGNAIYKDVVKKYAREIGLDPRGINVHGLRATAATSALDHEADIAKVQAWLGHASISTTRLYDRRATQADESPTFKIAYE